MSNLITTTFEDLYNNAIQIFEDTTGVRLERQDAERLLMQLFSGKTYDAITSFNVVSQQNYLENMTDNQLDDYGMFFGVERLLSTPAKSVVRFTFDAPLELSTIIYKNTVVVGSNDNGNFNFKVLLDTYVQKGLSYIDIDVEEFLDSDTNSGDLANDIKIGNINTIDESTFQYSFLDSVSNIVESSDGADSETDEDYIERLTIAANKYSAAGTYEAYKLLCRELSVNIADIGLEKSGYNINLYTLPINYDEGTGIGVQARLYGDSESVVNSILLYDVELNNSNYGTLYWEIVPNGGNWDFSIYEDESKTSLVAGFINQAWSTPSMVINEYNSSGITGTLYTETLPIGYTGDDDSSNFILTNRIAAGIIEQAINPITGYSRIKPLNDVVTVNTVEVLETEITDLDVVITTPNIETTRLKIEQQINILSDELKGRVAGSISISKIQSTISTIEGVDKVEAVLDSTPATTEVQAEESEVLFLKFDVNNLEITIKS